MAACSRNIARARRLIEKRWGTECSTIEEACVNKGMKMTGQRRVIAKVLSDATDHPDVEEVYRRSTAIDPRISIATVYRTVRLFEKENILERHDFGDGRSRYEQADDDHHDHLIDIKTGEELPTRRSRRCRKIRTHVRLVGNWNL